MKFNAQVTFVDGVQKEKDMNKVKHLLSEVVQLLNKSNPDDEINKNAEEFLKEVNA